MFNKKGQMTILMVVIGLVLLFTVILLLAMGVTVEKFNDALNQNIDIGSVNLQEYNNQTFGQVHVMYMNNADWWGISLIFGMIIGLFLSAYFTRNSFPKWGIVLDIFIIIGIFIFSLYLSSTYQSMLDSLAAAGETFLEDYTTKTSMFILNLPVFVVIIGVVMMVLFHSSIQRKTEERFQQGGYLQGSY